MFVVDSVIEIVHLAHCNLNFKATGKNLQEPLTQLCSKWTWGVNKYGNIPNSIHGRHWQFHAARQRKRVLLITLSILLSHAF